MRIILFDVTLFSCSNAGNGLKGTRMTTAIPKLSLRERSKLRLRADLLEAALDLFDESDFSALNVENIARHAGCSKATVYVYYPGGRDDILCTLYEQISDQVSAEGERRRGEATTVHGRMIGLAEALLFISSRPRRGRFFAQLNPLLSPVLQPVLGKSSGRYISMLSEDMSAVTAEDVTALAILLVGALREASIKAAQHPELVPELLEGFSVLATSLLQTLSVANREE